MQPATSGRAASSKAIPTAFAQPGGVRSTTRLPVRLERDDPAAERRRQLAEPVEIGRAGMRVDEPAALAAHLHEPELRDVPGDGRLDGVETLVPERFDDVALGRELALGDEPEDRSLAFELVHVSTSSSRDRPAATSSPSIVSGGVRRRTSPRGADEQPRLERGGDDRPGRPVELGAEHEAAAAHLDDARERGEPGRELRASFPHRGEQRLVERLDDRAGGGADDGVAAERAPVVSRLEAVRGCVGDEERADREAVGEALCERDRVRRHAELLPREEAAGAADAALDLVEEQERAVLVREHAGGGEELGGGGMDPALSLHRLDQDRADVRPDRGGEGIGVVQLREADGRRERLERRPLARLARRRERAVRASVERAFERDDDRLSRRLPGPLQRRLDRLGTGVAEERACAAEAIGEQLGEAEHRLGRVEVRGVPERIELAVRRRERCRMAVPERDDGDPGEQVEVPLPVRVREPDAVARDEGDVVPRVRGQERLVVSSEVTRPPPSRRSRRPRPRAPRRSPRAAWGRSRRRARRRRAGAPPPRRGSSRRPRRRARGRARR